jgi:spore cortex biosynthesis protein YabQ
MESAASQPYIFLITIYGGMVAGAVYDVFRRIRRTLHCGRWSSALLDTLFIIVLGAIVAFVLYTANMGELRMYTFAGFALGFALYIAGLAPVVSYIAEKRKAKKTKSNEKTEK